MTNPDRSRASEEDVALLRRIIDEPLLLAGLASGFVQKIVEIPDDFSEDEKVDMLTFNSAEVAIDLMRYKGLGDDWDEELEFTVDEYALYAKSFAEQTDLRFLNEEHTEATTNQGI